MKSIARLLLCLVTFSVCAQEAPFSWTLKEHKSDSVKSLNMSGWSIIFVNKAQVPISIEWLVANPKPSNDGSKVTPPSGSAELKPGVQEESYEFFCAFGVKPDVRVWVKGSGGPSSGASKPSQGNSGTATGQGSQQQATAPANDPSNGSEAVRQAMLDALKKQRQGPAAEVVGAWVCRSGPKGIGSVDENGRFGVNGEVVWYQYVFSADGTGTFIDEENNKISRDGSRTTYTMKRDLKWTASGQKIVVTLGPGQLVKGNPGNWILPGKTMTQTFTLRDGELDLGAGWICKRQTNPTSDTPTLSPDRQKLRDQILNDPLLK